MRLRNKVAIITGSSSGIGSAIAKAYGASGAQVVVDYLHDEAGARSTVQHIVESGGRACAVQADVSAIAGIDRLITACVETYGVPDILVNNAGVETRSGLLECTEEEFDRVMAVDLKGPFFCTQRGAQVMINAGRTGRIINISSTHEDRPMPGNIAYCCAKGGMRMLTRTAGVELASRGITVVNIAPGAVDTPINAATLQDRSLHDRLLRSVPLGRVAQPEEVAELAVWLGTESASYITATTVVMDGGLMQAAAGL